MAIHKLKTVQPYFDEVVKGNKTFEVRKNDRDFKTNDIVFLEEYDAIKKEYTGFYVWGSIGYVLDNQEFLKDGYVAFSFIKSTNGKPLKE